MILRTLVLKRQQKKNKKKCGPEHMYVQLQARFFGPEPRYWQSGTASMFTSQQNHYMLLSSRTQMVAVYRCCIARTGSIAMAESCFTSIFPALLGEDR